MERSPPYRAPPRASPYQEGVPLNISSSQYASQRSNETITATPAKGYYYSPSPYNTTNAASLQASMQAAPRLNVSNTSTSSTGPRMLAPPKAVQSIYASYAPPSRSRVASDAEAEQIQMLNVSNLKLLEQLERTNPVSKIPPTMYETDTKCYVQGFKKADGTLVVRRRATTKPVHFRECTADESQKSGQVLAFHVEGASDSIIIDNCKRVRVMVDSVIRKAVLIGCHDVEIVIGGIPPQVVLVSSSNCCIATSKDDWLSDIETVGCCGVSVLIAKGEDGDQIMPVQKILHAPDLERVLLPDALLTAVRKGTVATQCHYVDEAAVPPLLEPRGNDPSSAMPPQPKEAPDYAAVTHESSQFTVEYVSSICSVGLLFANDNIGTRVTGLETGGSAQKNGRIKEGDYLMSVDGVDIRGYPVQEIHTLLMGPQGTTTTVGMCRLGSDGTLVEGYDVVLTRMPISRSSENDAMEIPQELPTPYYNRREPMQQLQAALAASPPDMATPPVLPPGLAPVEMSPWQQPAQDPGLTPTQPEETKSWKWTPKAPTPGNLGGIPSAWKDRDKETEAVLSQTAKPLPPSQGIIHRSGTQSALNKSAASNASIYASGLGEDGQFRSAGIGLAVQQGPMGLYAISTVVPGGPADTSGQIKKGDIVHSVNGTVLAGKPPEAFKDLVWGVPGSEVMLALLRPEAQPQDMYKELTEFEWWRPVILIRSHRTRPVADGVGVPPPLPGDILVNQSAGSVFKSTTPGQSVSQMPAWRPDESLVASRAGAGGESVMASGSGPQRESFVSAAGRVTIEGPSGRQLSAEEGVGVALWLDEDLTQVAGTEGDEASFRARLVHDLASCLAVRPRQLNIAGLQAGSVIAQVELHPCEDGRDDRSPMQLAGELVHQAISQESRLRAFRSTRRATMAKIMGPLSALRPDQQSDPLAMPSLAPSGTPQTWQAAPTPKSIQDDPVAMREQGRGLVLRSQASAAASPYPSNVNGSTRDGNLNDSRRDPTVNGNRSLHTSQPDLTSTSRSYHINPEPAGKRLLSGVLAGKEREAGVGLGLGQRDGAIEVVSLVPGEAASESGEIFERNLLVSVDDLPLRQMSMEQILSLVNGPAGSRVKLGLVRLAGSPGGMPDQDVMVTVELTRGENERVREAQREKEAAEVVRREEWMRAQNERTEQLRLVAQREQERIMLREQAEMAELMRLQNKPDVPDSAVRFTGPARIVALTRKYDAIRHRVGLGMSLTSVHPSGEILVAGTPEGGAAHDSKQVVVGDVIHQVNSTDVKGKEVAEVVELIRGEQGTAVVLLIQGTTLDPTALDPTINSSSIYTSRDLGRSMGGNEMTRVALVRLSPSLSAVPAAGEEMQGGVGIGLGLSKDGVHFVNGMLQGGSAERSGQIQKGDRIVAIDDVHTTGRSVEEVMHLVRGRVGSTAVLTLERGAILTSLHRPQYEGTPRQPPVGAVLSDLDQYAQTPVQQAAELQQVPQQAARELQPMARGIDPVEERFELEEVPKPKPSPPNSARGQPEPVRAASPTLSDQAPQPVAQPRSPSPIPDTATPAQPILQPPQPSPPMDPSQTDRSLDITGALASMQPPQDVQPAAQAEQRAAATPGSILKPAAPPSPDQASRALDLGPVLSPSSPSFPAAPTEQASRALTLDTERLPIAAPERTPMQGPNRLEIPDSGRPDRQPTPPSPPRPVPEFHKPPTPPPSHGAGVATPAAPALPRATQTYNVRVVSGADLLSASPDPDLITSTIACNLKAVNELNGAVLANLETVVEGDLNDDGTVMFRGVATDVTVLEADIPNAELQLGVWDVSGGDRGYLGDCRLPLSKLPIGKDLKVSVPIDEPDFLPPQGWVGQAAGSIYLRILSKEPDMGWAG